MAFYDRLDGTIAFDFVAELERVVERIAEFPDAGVSCHGGARRLLINRFPVAVIYRTRGSTVEIIALAHQRRLPDYWALREAPPHYQGSVAGLPDTAVLVSEQALADSSST